MKIVFEDCLIDTDARELSRDGAAVAVEPKVFHVLCHLIENRERAVSKDELLAQVWDGRIVSDSALSSAIKAARAAIGDSGTRQGLIKTVHGHGFRFVGHAVAMGDAQPANDTPTPAPQIQQDIRYCQSDDGTKIAYALSGDGPVVVKSANWMSHLQYELESPIWRPWVEALSQRFRLLRYDERGNGLSERAPGDLSFEARVTDLERVIEHAGITEPAVLFGISAGCSFCVEYAVRHPDRVKALILYGGFPQGWRPRKNEREHSLAHALRDLMESGWGRDNPVFRQMFTMLFMPKATEEQKDWFNELQRKTVKPAIAAKLWDAAGDIDVLGKLGQVQAPTLVVHASEDGLVPVRLGQELAGGIPNARYVQVASENHVLLGHETAFAQFFEEVDRFVASLG